MYVCVHRKCILSRIHVKLTSCVYAGMPACTYQYAYYIYIYIILHTYLVVAALDERPRVLAEVGVRRVDLPAVRLDASGRPLPLRVVLYVHLCALWCLCICSFVHLDVCAFVHLGVWLMHHTKQHIHESIRKCEEEARKNGRKKQRKDLYLFGRSMDEWLVGCSEL